MALELHNLKPAKGSRQRKQRIGRGLARRGTTAGRGSKGQRSRSGGKNGLAIRGLRQTLLRIPKQRGFKSKAPSVPSVNVSDFEKVEGKVVSPQTLKKAGLISSTKKVKILGRGEVKEAVVVRGCLVSDGAREKIEGAGGKIE